MNIAAALALILVPASIALAGTPAKTVVLPADTEIHLQLAETISSHTAKAGEIVRFRTVGDTTLKGILVVPDGTEADGVVLDVKRKGYLGRPGLLDIGIKFLRMDHGVRVPLDGAIEQDGEGHISRTRLLAGAGAALFPTANIVLTEGTPMTAYVDQATTVPLPAN